MLESTLNSAIEQALDLSVVQGFIVTRNVQLRDKIHVLKCIVDLVGNDKARFTKVLNEIADMSRVDRNVIAHDMFWPDDEGDGVKFNVVKATGKLAVPDVRWSQADFEAKYEKIINLHKEVGQLTIAIKPFSLARALREAPAGPTGNAMTNAMLSGLGLLGPQTQPLPGNPDSNPLPASPKTDDETPPSSQK